jgi:methylmalonyl-CoA/ethylmalonyl-CoA epimerase
MFKIREHTGVEGMEEMAELGGLPGIEGIDHLAIAVPQGELEAQVAAWARLGFREIYREEVRGSDMVREAMLELDGGPPQQANSGLAGVPGGASRIQLLEPLSAESPVQKLIERNGGRGGFAHLAFRVKSAQQAFAAMQAAGFRLIDAAPRAGGHGTTVFFVHPRSQAGAALGILMEIVEVPR